MLLAVIYRPPGSDSDLSLLESSLGSLNVLNYNKVLIIGDFNIDLSDSLSSPTQDLLATMNGFGLHQIVNNPTCITPTSLLDLVFCNNLVSIENLSIKPELRSSDHCSLLCHLSVAKPSCTPFKRKIWLYQKTDLEALNMALDNSLLGVLVNSKLSWVPHIHEVVAKRLLGFLYRVFRECGSNYLSPESAFKSSKKTLIFR